MATITGEEESEGRFASPSTNSIWSSWMTTLPQTAVDVAHEAWDVITLNDETPPQLVIIRRGNAGVMNR